VLGEGQSTKTEGKNGGGKKGEAPRHDEGDELVAPNVVPGCGGACWIIPNRLENAACRTVHESFNHNQGQQEQNGGENVERPLVGNERRAPHPPSDVLTTRPRGPAL